MGRSSVSQVLLRHRCLGVTQRFEYWRDVAYRERFRSHDQATSASSLSALEATRIQTPPVVDATEWEERGNYRYGRRGDVSEFSVDLKYRLHSDNLQENNGPFIYQWLK
jgi:hypothetical protein